MSAASEQFYRGESGQRYQQQKRAVPDEAIPWVARLRAQKLQPLIEPNHTVIEFGVGLGWNLAHLKCARRIGTDLEDFLPPALKETGVQFVARSEDIPSASADVLICHHVLEHVENPVEMLRESFRVLKVGGKLLIFVPYEKERKYRNYDPNEPNHHLFSWNPQTLANLIQTQHFTILQSKIGEFGYDRFAARLALRFHLGHNGFRAFRRLAQLFRPAREVQLIATKPPIREKA